MTFSLWDPLEQFSIEVFSSYLFPLIFFSNFKGPFWFFLSIPSTSISKMVMFNCLLVIIWFYSLNPMFTINKLQKIIFLVFLFVVNILRDSVSITKYSFILIFQMTFMFLFFSNLLGMLPYSMTVTSHLILTLLLSLAFFIGSNIIGVCYHKQSFFLLFLPEGVPLLITPFLIIIEYVSYVSRIFSLAIRLFANMLSGHILLKILISFIWVIIVSNLAYWMFNILPLAIVFSVIGLEVSIAFLQAYVFLVLITIYLKDVIHTH